MKLGDLEFWLLTDGTFRLDGGAMFGAVPRPKWELAMPPDHRNRILLAMNCLLIRTAGKWILVETGAGNKWDAKRNDIYAFEDPPRLPDKLLARGVRPEQIDIVINTHLHLDHCGWNTRHENGKTVATFPNAQYIVQRQELEHAKNPTERDSGSYIPDNFRPLEESNRWLLVDGDYEVVPGVEVIRTPGHNRDMMCVRLIGGGYTALFFSDLVPTVAHLRYSWIMAYDLYPLTILDSKKKWIQRAAREGWLVVFGHEANTPAGYLREHEGTYILEPVPLGS